MTNLGHCPPSQGQTISSHLFLSSFVVLKRGVKLS